jgi:hypothetical protein
MESRGPWTNFLPEEKVEVHKNIQIVDFFLSLEKKVCPLKENLGFHKYCRQVSSTGQTFGAKTSKKCDHVDYSATFKSSTQFKTTNVVYCKVLLSS